MKHKPVVIFLLIVVVVIWGSVIYRFITNIGVDTADWLNTDEFRRSLRIPTKQELDFELSLKYDDPFLVSRKKSDQKLIGEDKQMERVFEDEINSKSFSSNSSGLMNNTSNQYKNSRNHNYNSRELPYKWPHISYHGVVKRSENKNSGLLMVKFENQLINIRQGEYFMGDFKITRSWRDSIEISNGRHEKKMFYR